MVTTGDEMAAEAAQEEPRAATDRFRSVAQLNMLHSLAAKLNSLDDAVEISSAITAELRTIVAYHSCRVYLLQPDGRTLYPVAFRGEMFSDYEKDTVESLITEIGEGITGSVAETRRVAHHAGRARGGVRRPDPRHGRRAGVDARRAHGRRRPVAGCHHALDARLREVRRGGSAAARGPRIARSRGVPEREAVPSRARGGRDLDRPPAAVADVDAAPLDRRHPAGGDRHRPPPGRGLRSGGLPPRRGDRGLPTPAVRRAGRQHDRSGRPVLAWSRRTSPRGSSRARPNRSSSRATSWRPSRRSSGSSTRSATSWRLRCTGSPTASARS